MKTASKKTYTTPELRTHGSFEEITKQGGGSGIDGIIGIDIDGDGIIGAGDVVTGVTNGSM